MAGRQVRKAKPQVRRRVTAWIESDRLTTKARRHKEETRHDEGTKRRCAPGCRAHRFGRLGVGMSDVATRMVRAFRNQFSMEVFDRPKALEDMPTQSRRRAVGVAPNDGGVQPARSGCAEGIEKTGPIPEREKCLQPSRQPPIAQREHNEPQRKPSHHPQPRPQRVQARAPAIEIDDTGYSGGLSYGTGQVFLNCVVCLGVDTSRADTPSTLG